MKNLFSRIFNPLLFVLILSTVLLTLVSAYYSYRENGEIQFTLIEPKAASLDNIYVNISGAIQNPGVYELEENTRLIDLISKAGGYNQDADQQAIANNLNLAVILKDEQKVIIPSLKPISSTVQESKSDLINLNTASKEKLDSLPGIGPSTAQKIIDARPYSSVEDLLNVPGIGESKFEEIQNLIEV